jgi:glutamate decarboxylase
MLATTNTAAHDVKKEDKERTGRNFHRVRHDPSFHSFAFSSRYFEKEVPKYDIPEKMSAANAVYQLIHDELELDGKPIQNMATFVSTWMEPEADRLLVENLSKNFADADEYPKTQEVQERCVNMLSRLWHAPRGARAVGTSCVGSSEAFLLGALSHKKLWQQKNEG